MSRGDEPVRDFRAHCEELSRTYKTHMKNARYQQAIHAIEEAMRGSPDNADLYDDLSLCFSRLGQHNRAIDAIDRAIQIAPNERKRFTNKGVRLVRAGRLDEAEACAIEATRLDPSDPGGAKLLLMVAEAREKMRH